jgi:hypothetical protein
MSRLVGCLWLLLALARAHAVAAENAHESSLSLEVAAVSLEGEWKVRILDIDPALQLDANHDGTVTWPEIEHRRGDIETYLGTHLRLLAGDVDLPFHFERLMYGVQGGEPFLLAQLTADAPQPIATLGIDYSLPTRRANDRCAVKVIWPGQGMHEAEIVPGRGVLTFARATAGRSAFLDSLQQGVWHIWSGYDHVLFLLVLLIPAVFQRIDGTRAAVTSFRGVLLRVVIIVSAFTVAHSITLTCAAMGWIRLPSRLVESVIAASILIAALNNFQPRAAGERSAWLAFGFGLIHGFGFAGALTEIGTQGGPLWRTLVAFNFGVETGQLAIVAVFLPLAYWLRQTRFYRTGVLYGGSSIAGVCALFWLWERAFGGSV